MDFDALVQKLPSWSRLVDAGGYAQLLDDVRRELRRRGLEATVEGESARIQLGDGSFEMPLLPLAETVHALPRPEWAATLHDEIGKRIQSEELGRELDAVRGDFARARERLKLRLYREDEVGPGTVGAPVAEGLRAVLVLDLPTFVTPVRAADLASWERPADELVRLALDNIRSQEQVQIQPMQLAGASLFAVSGPGVFVSTLALAADELLVAKGAKLQRFGALLAMPSRHILLVHAIEDQRSHAVLQAMAAGALQAFRNSPGPLVPHLFWKREDRFLALPVSEEDGKVRCDVPRQFDDEVLAQLPPAG